MKKFSQNYIFIIDLSKKVWYDMLCKLYGEFLSLVVKTAGQFT